MSVSLATLKYTVNRATFRNEINLIWGTRSKPYIWYLFRICVCMCVNVCICVCVDSGMRFKGSTSSIGCSTGCSVSGRSLHRLVGHDSSRELLLGFLKASTSGTVECVYLGGRTEEGWENICGKMNTMKTFLTPFWGKKYISILVIGLKCTFSLCDSVLHLVTQPGSQL